MAAHRAVEEPMMSKVRVSTLQKTLLLFALSFATLCLLAEVLRLIR